MVKSFDYLRQQERLGDPYRSENALLAGSR